MSECCNKKLDKLKTICNLLNITQLQANNCLLLSKGFDCQDKDDGLYQDPDNCAGFIQCANGRTFHMKCAPGTQFNALLKVCDWPHNVICPGEMSVSTPC